MVKNPFPQTLKSSDSALGDLGVPSTILNGDTLIQELRRLPPFNQATGVTLNSLLTLVSNSSTIDTSVQEAIRNTLRLWYDLEGSGGNKHIALFDQEERLRHVEQLLRTPETPSPPPATNERLFVEDEYGTPLSWHDRHELNQSRIHRGYHNFAMYKFAAQVEAWQNASIPLTAGGFDHACYVALCDALASGVEFMDPTINLPEWNQKTAQAREHILKGRPELARALISEFLTMRVLPHLSGNTDILDRHQRLALRCYSPNTPPSDELWRTITTINKGWADSNALASEKREGYKEPFTRSELEACIAEHNGTLLTLCFDEKVAYFGLCYSDPTRIPPVTRCKIDTATNVGFISSEKSDSWVYLVARNPSISLALHRAVRCDWYSVFIEAIGDVAIGNGAERVVGRVLDSNSSKYAHFRAGARSARTRFVDPLGVESEIISIEFI